jgi:hypothetical protein
MSDEKKAMRKLISILNGVLVDSNVDTLKNIYDDNFVATVTEKPNFQASPIQVWLNILSARLDKDLVVFFDEADSLKERILLSFLTQLRDGYIARSMRNPFPRSIALISMLNIRDYKAKIRPESATLDSTSPFNIVAKALTLADFSRNDIKNLYRQHTVETGQIFEDSAVERAWYWSEGQPWLVNALANQAVVDILKCDYAASITSEHIDQAANNLMKIRDTHIDSLMARLHEPRVKRFIEPMLSLSKSNTIKHKFKDSSELLSNDLQYCLDLGLIKSDNILRPANPIYASVIIRYLSSNYQIQLIREISESAIRKWMDAESIDMTGLLKEFQTFWASKSEKYLKGFNCLEAGPLILLSAFLRRVVNGGAIILEEYADGLGYIDIDVKYTGQNYVIELKIKENQRSQARSQEQILRYMRGLSVKEGWLVIFDRKSDKSWTEKKIWKTVNTPKGEIIHIVGC